MGLPVRGPVAMDLPAPDHHLRCSPTSSLFSLDFSSNSSTGSSSSTPLPLQQKEQPAGHMIDDQFSLFSSLWAPCPPPPVADPSTAGWGGASTREHQPRTYNSCSNSSSEIESRPSRSSSAGDLTEGVDEVGGLLQRLDIGSVVGRAPSPGGDNGGGARTHPSAGSCVSQGYCGSPLNPLAAQQGGSQARAQQQQALRRAAAGDPAAAAAAYPRYLLQQQHLQQALQQQLQAQLEQQQFQQNHQLQPVHYAAGPVHPALVQQGLHWAEVETMGGRFSPASAAAAAAEARATRGNDSSYLGLLPPPSGHRRVRSHGNGGAPAGVAAFPFGLDSRQACEAAVVRESADILRDAVARSLRAVELANALRSRLGTDALARARELHGGLLSLLERHPSTFRVDRVPKADLVTLIAPVPLDAPEPLSSSTASVLSSSARRGCEAPAYGPPASHQRASACAHHPAPLHHHHHHAPCAGQQLMCMSSCGSCSGSPGMAPMRGDTCPAAAAPPLRAALVPLAMLTSDRFVPTQTWPVNPQVDWPFVMVIAELLKAAGGNTTVSKLRGLLRARLGSAATIKSVPLKAMLSAYTPPFALCGNRIAIMTSSPIITYPMTSSPIITYPMQYSRCPSLR